MTESFIYIGLHSLAVMLSDMAFFSVVIMDELYAVLDIS
mgnify:CR=1 FL=1